MSGLSHRRRNQFGEWKVPRVNPAVSHREQTTISKRRKDRTGLIACEAAWCRFRSLLSDNSLLRGLLWANGAARHEPSRPLQVTRQPNAVRVRRQSGL